MRRPMLQYLRIFAFSFFAFMFTPQPGLHAQTHVVTPAELQKDAADSTRTRQQNEQTVNGLLTSPEGVKALQSAHADPAQVTSAVSQLDDEDLAKLAAQSQKAQDDFAAGRLSDRDLIIIILAIVALVLIIVAVH